MADPMSGAGPEHLTCVETTSHFDMLKGERTWVHGQDCPRPAGPDPARDRRRDLYADRERRRAARALDRFLEAFNEFGTAGSTGARVAGERFVEQVGDYVLARLGASIEAELGPSAARDVADRMHDEAYGLHQKAHYGVPIDDPDGLLDRTESVGPTYREMRNEATGIRVTDASAVHVPHRHLDDGPACSSVGCHSLDGKPCTFCGGQRCRVVLE